MNLSGEYFYVTYQLMAASEKQALEMARALALEQTVEFPEELIANDFIRGKIVGKIINLEPLAISSFQVNIQYLADTAGQELPQWLNVVFGNSSLKPGIRVIGLEPAPGFKAFLPGPRLGRKGLREWLSVPKRPLLCTALKPLGLASHDLAELAYTFALGGIDIIKDDHGLANQGFAPFAERVRLCAAAVAKANAQTGYQCVYAPNVTGPIDQVRNRAQAAKQAGARGLLLAPGLTSWDTLRQVASDPDMGLPIFCHPAWLGSFTLSREQGISPDVLLGSLPRWCGADATIFPNFGGRFSFTREECQAIARATETPSDIWQPIFPCPAGGMDLDRVPEMLELYGTDVIFLIGGGLFSRGPNLLENCRYFRKLIE